METAFAAGDGVPLGVTKEGRASALAWAPPGFHAFDRGRTDDGEAVAAESAPSPAGQPATGTAEAPAPETPAPGQANAAGNGASAEAPPAAADTTPADKPGRTSVVESIESPPSQRARPRPAPGTTRSTP